MKLLSKLAVLLVYLFLFLPMVVLVVLSFNAAPRGSAWTGFTTHWYVQLLKNQAILEALCNSFEIAVVATVMSAIFGTAAGLAMRRSRKPWRLVIGNLATLPMVLPDIMLGLSLLCFFVWLAIPLGKLSVMIAHTAFGAAYVASLVRSRLYSVDPNLEEAAADLGAGPWGVFFKVLLPQLWPAVFSGMLMVFTLSFDDFSIAFFTAGVGATTLPLKIYSMLKFGISPEVNALSAFILLASLIMVTVAFRNYQKAMRS